MVLRKAEALGPVPDAVVDAALDGDAAAREDLAGRLHEDACPGILAALDRVEAEWTAARDGLGAWLPQFQAIEDRIGRLERLDAERRAPEAAILAPEALIESATSGVRWLPDAQVRRVILAPSYFARPYNHIYQGQDWRLFCYPILDAVIESADAAMPPGSMLRLYRALSDPTRMRTLKLLTERDWYLTELATQLELSKPTMKHHLALLRAAGLVTVTEEGSLTYYSLRRERIDEAGTELRRFMG